MEKDGYVEANSQNRGDDPDPFQALLQGFRVRRLADAVSAEGNPDHPEAVGKEEETSCRDGAERLQAAVIEGDPLKAFNKLLRAEKSWRHGQWRIGLLIGCTRDVSAVEADRHQDGSRREAGGSRKTHSRTVFASKLVRACNWASSAPIS